MRRILERLPLVFFGLYPLFWAAAFYLTMTPYRDIAAVLNYPVYAIAVTGMWFFLLSLLLRSKDGTGSVLLVCLFYETGFFALTLWAVSVIATLSIFGYENHFLESTARSFVAGSAGVVCITAAAVYGAWRRNLLDERIKPWPSVTKRRK